MQCFRRRASREARRGDGTRDGDPLWTCHGTVQTGASRLELSYTRRLAHRTRRLENVSLRLPRLQTRLGVLALSLASSRDNEGIFFSSVRRGAAGALTVRAMGCRHRRVKKAVAAINRARSSGDREAVKQAVDRAKRLNPGQRTRAGTAGADVKRARRCRDVAQGASEEPHGGRVTRQRRMRARGRAVRDTRGEWGSARRRYDGHQPTACADTRDSRDGKRRGRAHAGAHARRRVVRGREG